MVEFIVLDVEPTGDIRGKNVLADVTVSRASDLGTNDQTYYIRSHLGAILHPGDSCMGYFLTNTNLNSDLWDTLDTDNTPEVVLVKKHYERKSKKSKYRNWKLKRMAKEYNEMDDATRQARQEQEKAERDYELFLQELEEDEELRQTVNMYKAPTQAQFESDMDDDDEAPEVGLDELLDEMDEMTIS